MVNHWKGVLIKVNNSMRRKAKELMKSINNKLSTGMMMWWLFEIEVIEKTIIF